MGGMALEGALILARELCSFPQGCMRSDRQSSYDQWSMSLPEALEHETAYGNAVIDSGETKEGAARFASGKGRHGNFTEI
jgi:enoyl-CoA hydratase